MIIVQNDKWVDLEIGNQEGVRRYTYNEYTIDFEK